MRTAPVAQCRGTAEAGSPVTPVPPDPVVRPSTSFPVTTPVRLAELVCTLADIAVSLTDAATALAEIARSSARDVVTDGGLDGSTP